MGIIEIGIFTILFIYVAIKGEKKEKIVAVVGAVILFLIAALRDKTVGIDTPGYVNHYKLLASLDFGAMKEYVVNNPDKYKDPTFYYIGWIFSRVFSNPQWWLSAIALIYVIAVGKLIYNESKQSAISWLVLVSLSFYSISLTGLRQTVAMSILILGYPFLKERRFIPFLITVLIAGLYHQTSLVFLAIYPIATKRLGVYHLIFAAVAFIIFYSFQDWLLNFLGDVLKDDRFKSYTGGEASQLTMAGFAIQTVCLIFALYYYKELTSKDETAIILYNLSFVGWVIQIFSSFIAEFFRVSMYFSIFNIILVANAASMEKDKRSRSILQMVVAIIFILYMIKDGKIYYEFFWQ